MKSLGADVLRLWVASTDYRYEMSVSDEILKRTSDAYRRLRNTARFLLANLDGFDPAQHLVGKNDLLALDRWVVDKAWQLQKEIKIAYDEYQFQVIYQKVLNFCSIDLGGFYLDIVKDRQYTAKEDCLARRSGQTAMYHVIEAMVRWLRRSPATPPTKSGLSFPANAASRYFWKPGTKACSRWRPTPRSTATLGTKSWRCARRCPRNWKVCARTARSARR